MRTLDEVLGDLLEPAGFRRAKGSQAYRRVRDGVRQTVQLRRSRDDAELRAVVFSATDEEAKTGPTHELSPLAPLENTYWWPVRLSAEEGERLAVQVRQVLLPFFLAAPGRFDEARAEAAARDVLAALVAADPAFERTGLTCWRRRGRRIGLADLELLAGNRFAFVYATVWRDDLEDGIGGPPPDGITRVTSCTAGPDRIDEAPNTSLFYLGPPCPGTLPLAGAAPGVAGVLLRYFDAVVTVANVLARVRPEYRSHLAGTRARGSD